MDESPNMGIGLFIIFIVLNSILYAFYSAISNLNVAELEKWEEENNRKASKCKRYLENRHRDMITMETIFMIMSMVVGCGLLPRYAGWMMNEFFYGRLTVYITDSFAWIISYVLVGVYFVFIMLAIGVLTPKRLGEKFSNQVAFALVDVAGIIMCVAKPLTALIRLLTNLILGIFGLEDKEGYVKVTEEGIMSMVNEGHEKGVIHASEAQMITNIFEFGDKEAKDIMIHRTNILSIDGDWKFEDAVKFILQNGNSRFPVMVDDLDNIIGILTFRDAMVHYEQKELREKKVKDIPNLMREAFFVPETKNLDLIFRHMQSEKNHMTIVVDEYGQTAGVVTMEDILEEIVGNILDEYDEDEQNIIRLEDGSYMIKGLTPLEDIRQELQKEHSVSFEEEDVDTLNGYLIAKLEHIPGDDEKPVIELDGIQYQVLKVANKMIKSVKMSFLELENQEEEKEN